MFTASESGLKIEESVCYFADHHAYLYVHAKFAKDPSRLAEQARMLVKEKKTINRIFAGAVSPAVKSNRAVRNLDIL